MGVGVVWVCVGVVWVCERWCRDREGSLGRQIASQTATSNVTNEKAHL